MDGEAITAAFASTPGPDCLRDVIPKLGHRVKVYQAIKLALEVISSRSCNKMGWGCLPKKSRL